jgi:proteic killer suppression protein
VQLTALDVAKTSADMNLPGFGLHPLHKDLIGHWSIKVNGIPIKRLGLLVA